MTCAHRPLAALVADATAPVVAAVSPDADLPSQVVAVLAVEEEQTADRRIFDSGAFTWREPPLTFTLNHDPDLIVGRITAIGRAASADGLTVDNFAERAGTEGDLIVGLIEFDLGLNSAGELVNPDALGRQVALQVDGEFLLGVSVEYGNEAVEMECLELDEEGFCLDYLLRFSAAEIGQASVTGFQALDGARIITPSADADTSTGDDAEGDAIAASANRWTAPVATASLDRHLIASAAPDTPSAADFADPGLLEPTALTVDGDRIYGHAALWNTCHVGVTDRCILAPHSPTDYAYFHTGEVDTVDGPIAVGIFTMDTGHADIYDEARRPLSAQQAQQHYDDTGTQAAFVRAGEDEHGIWLAGVLAPGLTDRQRTALRAAAASGDWRRIGGALELISVLAVNTPGFPVPRARAIAASGAPAALVAAGIPVRSTGCGCSGGCRGRSSDADLAAKVARHDAIIAALGLDEQAVDAIAASVRP